MDRRPDSALVGAVLAGEKDAFCALVRRYQDFAYGVAVGMLSDFDLAQDVVQEAFLSAYRGLPRLKDPGRFGGWLRGIVRHTAHRALRDREHFRQLTERLWLEAETGPGCQSADRLAEEAERREVVRRALEQLDDKNREAISLYYIDDLSYGEIAEFLSVTEAAVKGRLQRGRAQLKEGLKMVEDTFKERKLPDDFAAEIGLMLDAWAARGVEQKEEIERLVQMGGSAVDRLLEALRDPRPVVRRGAANALCAIGDPRALNPIMEEWRAYRLQFRFKDLLAIPGAREALLRIVRESGDRDLWWELEALRHAKGDNEVFDALYGIFRSRRKHRGATLDVLCDIRPERAADLLVEALNDPDPRIRARAPWAALRRGLVLPIEACLKAFGDRVRWWERLCAGKLVLLRGEEGQRALERVMQTGSPAERATAALTLATEREPTDEAFRVLTQELVRGSRDRRWIKAVSRTLARRYGPRLAQWVQAEPGLVASVPNVAWALAMTAGAESGTALEGLWRNATPSVRAAAVRMLAREHGRAFLPELRRCLREGRPRKVAREAFRHVLRLGDAARPTAQQMLRSSHWTERKAAVALLRRWGQLTPDQRAQAQNDPHIAVRLAAKVHTPSADGPTGLA